MTTTTVATIPRTEQPSHLRVGLCVDCWAELMRSLTNIRPATIAFFHMTEVVAERSTTEQTS
jgi:hypothetical protein